MSIYRIYVTILFTVIEIVCFSQKSSGFGVMSRHGIYFGRPYNYNGIRLNIIDLDSSEKINGINFSLLNTRFNRSNGITISLINFDKISSIASVGIIGNAGLKRNGLSISGLIQEVDKINGVGIAGFTVSGDTLNGLFVGVWGVARWNGNIKVINGLAMGGIGVSAEKINGIAIGSLVVSEIQNGISFALFNSTKNLKGIQIGIINHVANNPKGLKWLPLINFHI